MLNFREIAFGLYGACQFAKFDRSAAQYFDNTLDAFWRSFQAAIIALPAYVLLQLLHFAENPISADPVRILFIETTAYVIGWIVFPLIMVSFTDTIDRGDRYFRFIAAWNWGMVLQVFVYLVIVALISSGTVPAALAGLLSISALFAVLGYQGFIALVTLNIRVPAASIIVLIDLVIAIGLNQVTRSLYAG